MDFEDLCLEMLDECLEKAEAFKKFLMNKTKDKMVDAVNALDITEVVQRQTEEMIEYMLNEDSELCDGVRDTLSDLISDKIEATFKQ